MLSVGKQCSLCRGLLHLLCKYLALQSAKLLVTVWRATIEGMSDNLREATAFFQKAKVAGEQTLLF